MLHWCQKWPGSVKHKGFSSLKVERLRCTPSMEVVFPVAWLSSRLVVLEQGSHTKLSSNSTG